MGGCRETKRLTPENIRFSDVWQRSATPALAVHSGYTNALFVAVTDSEWFGLHASKSQVDEVNFWRPSPEATFKALQPGELLLYKLHSPDNFIAGGGFFTKFLQLPVNLAWDSFREANGVRSLREMRERIGFYRRMAMLSGENPTIGCILLAEPFFWPREAWIPALPISN
jgi:putative restriction endonuclease